MGSGNRHLVEVMLREVDHTPGPELEGAEDREGYALAAGLALGMIALAVSTSPSTCMQVPTSISCSMAARTLGSQTCTSLTGSVCT